MYIYFDGKFVPEEDAKISVKTHALHYGTACFEGIRAYYNEKDNSLYIFRMEDHFKRLMQSAKVLFIKLPHSVDELCSITVKLLQKNFQTQDTYIRPLAYKSDPAVGNFDLRKLGDSILIYSTPLGRIMKDGAGVRVNVSSWRRIPDNAIPPRAKISGAYVNTCLAKTESLAYGFEEALLLDQNGHITEGSAENIFMVKDGVAITPSVSDDILQGITRDTVIKILTDLKIPVIERSIDRSEIYSADEVMLTGTAVEISTVIEVDNRMIGEGKAGEIVTKVKDAYFKIVHGSDPAYKYFVTKVTPV